MKLNIAGKEINIEFGYKPTLKERIVSKVVELSKSTDESGNMDMKKLEDLMLFLPEMLLVGMQVHHEDYRYNYDTGEGKEEQLEKAFKLVEKHMKSEDADIMALFGKLQEALMQDSFLAGLYKKEQKKAETAQMNGV
ncbi:MAG: hypothetical protein SPJ92_03295 [Bariatricus sp.]|nr:hypothetical protein [Bariatricus sp.]